MRLIDADIINFYKATVARGMHSFDNVEIVEKFQIDRIPTIDPESLRRHAKWIFVREDKKCGAYCSSCMFPVWTGTNYCPHCGAIMDLEDDK